MIKMPTIYVRNVPQDLKKELEAIQKALGCKTMVTFLYEVARRLRKELEEEGHLLE